jgi:hypothetical protein
LHQVAFGELNFIFKKRQPADEGTSRIEFVAPGGHDNGAAIFAGESNTFMITAEPGQKLQIQTMFVQSNDWFYSFGDGGLSLFDGDSPINGDMTSKLILYDAGTEADEPPGLGITQKPDQDPLAFNIGPDDSVNMIKEAVSRHSTFIIPSTSSVIRVTVTPQ